MVSQVLLAILAGGATAAMARLGAGRRSPVVLVLVALLGALGGILGLYASRFVGMSRDDEARVFVLCAAFGLGVTLTTLRMARARAPARPRR